MELIFPRFVQCHRGCAELHKGEYTFHCMKGLTEVPDLSRGPRPLSPLSQPLRLHRPNLPLGRLLYGAGKSSAGETGKVLLGALLDKGQPCGSRVTGRRICVLLSAFLTVFCQLAHFLEAGAGLRVVGCPRASLFPCQHQLSPDG